MHAHTCPASFSAPQHNLFLVQPLQPAISTRYQRVEMVEAGINIQLDCEDVSVVRACVRRKCS